MTDEKRLTIDQVILVCKGCKGERLYYPKPAIVGAEAVIEWLKTQPTRCVCGAEKCDVKMRMVE